MKYAIFDANQACQDAIKIHGTDAVTNATIGVMLDEDGKLATLPTVEKVYRSLEMSELAAYAPIAGLNEYRTEVINLIFADSKPEGFFSAIATAGGTGAIHHAIANYAERGESVLTSDWFWGNYNVICTETGKRIDTFKLFDDELNFNVAAFEDKVDELLKVQKSLLVILNTPAHNPTGYALSCDEWKKVIDIIKKHAAQGKKIVLLVDIAYIDFAGEKNSTREFFKEFNDLPENVLMMVAFSMSKSYTFYGQRTGALVAYSKNKDVIAEFDSVGKYSSRAAWSNINRGAQALLVKLAQDKKLTAVYESERERCYQMIKKRANVFVEESKNCSLQGGIFYRRTCRKSCGGLQQTSR